MVQRGVLLSVCAAIGSPDDAAAAQEKLKTGEFRVPRETFLLAAAKNLEDAIGSIHLATNWICPTASS
jgi:hypothetical protein